MCNYSERQKKVVIASRGSDVAISKDGFPPRFARGFDSLVRNDFPIVYL